MTTTLHSIERARERAGMNPRAAEHFMRNALERGRDKTMFTCEKKRRWLSAKEEACGCRALAYQGCCIIRSAEGRCVTAYPLPPWFHRRQHYRGKEKIRNVKKAGGEHRI